MTNLTVIPEDIRPENTIQLKRDTIYGSTNDVLIDFIGSVAVDDSDRVYFTTGEPNGIKIFDPDGQYLTSIGRKGQGPGEFVSAPALYIISNRLYAMDLRTYRISVFSVDSLKLIHTVNIDATNKSKTLANYYIQQIIPNKDGTFLVCFKKFLRELPDLPEGTKIDTLYRSYYLMDKEGILIPKQVLKIKDQPVVTESINQEVFPVSFNFFSKPFIGVSNDGSIFVANSKEFLIKEYDSEGQYQRAFYNPYRNVSLTKETALESNYAAMNKLISGRDISEGMSHAMINNRLRLIRQIDLPPNWPALNGLLVDDENRLWVSTIVNDQEISQWWVLDQSGKLLARFNWPRSKQIEVIKNGYMYTLDIEESTGLQTIIKYRIEMKELEM